MPHRQAVQHMVVCLWLLAQTRTTVGHWATEARCDWGGGSSGVLHGQRRWAYNALTEHWERLVLLCGQDPVGKAAGAAVV